MSKNPPHKNQTGYNSWSSFYDTYPNPTVAIDELFFPQYWKHLTNFDVLEIGCGTGRHTRKLLTQNNHVTGIDISGGMLEVAKGKLPQENLQLLHGDFLTYDLPREQFDAAICSLVIEHISDLHLFFEKVRSCLKPGGSLYLSEIHPVRTSQGIMAHFKNDDGEETHLQSHPHTEKDFEVAAAHAHFEIAQNATVVGNEQLAQLNSKWIKHLNSPLIQIWIFKRKN